MPKLAWTVAFALIGAVPAMAETAVPDLRGAWKGNSESVVSGGANPHHAAQSAETRFSSIAFTLTVDKQDGRRFGNVLLGAHDRPSGRCDRPQRFDLHGGRRWIYRRYYSGAGPDRALLHARDTGSQGRLLHGADQATLVGVASSRKSSLSDTEI